MRRGNVDDRLNRVRGVLAGHRISVSFRGPTVAAAVALLALVSGCDGCQREHPYTPFRIDAQALASETPSATAAPSAVPADSAADVAEPQLATHLEPATPVLDLDGQRIQMPQGALAELVLQGDFGAGPGDAVVWMRPEELGKTPVPVAGELWLVTRRGPWRRLLSLPDWVPRGPGCYHEPHLSRSGKTTVTLDVRARCEHSMPDRTPTRAVAAVSLRPDRSLLVGFRLAEPAPDESVTISLDGNDRDGDSRDDVLAHFQLSLANDTASGQAEFAWLDRAAGPSQEPNHFSDFIARNLRALEPSARNKKRARQALLDSQATRRLVANLCAQSGTVRVWSWDGSELNCSGLSQLVQLFARVEVHGLVTLGDTLEATARMDRISGWFGGLRDVTRRNLVRLLSKSTLPVNVTTVVDTGIRAASSNNLPHYSPLAFRSDQTLLVQTGRGPLLWVGMDGHAEPADQDAQATWPLEVTGPKGQRWVNTVHGCDRAETLLVLRDSTGQLLPLAPTSQLAPRPGVCLGSRIRIRLAPIAWTSESPLSLIDGGCSAFGATDQCLDILSKGQVVLGSPRSPDGTRLVATSSMGLLVLGGAKPELWRGPGLPAPDTLEECVVANLAKAIACTANHRVVIVPRPSDAR